MKTLLHILIYVISVTCLAQEVKIATEDINLANGKIKLPGTLTYAEGQKTSPLVIWIHGSGNPDRNGNQAGANVKANYIKMVGDELNKAGIAFYRYDKRTATMENLAHSKGLTLDGIVDDAKVAIDHFKADKRFSQIILIGHSQGSLVSMLALDDSISKFVSLAGMGETLETSLVRQISAQSEALGQATQAHIDELNKTGTIKEVNPMLISIFAPANHPFLKSWLAYDPVEEMKKVNIPVLIVNGDADSQITVANAKALAAANTNATIKIIPKMNHVLKAVNNAQENMQSYYSADFKLADTLIDTLVAFINK